MASEIRSASLSGWPSVTDSDEKRYDPLIRRSLAGGSDARRSRIEQRRDPVEDGPGQLPLGPPAERHIPGGAQQHGLVGVGTEAGALAAHEVDHHEVEAFRVELPAAGPLEILGLGGEPDEHLV